MHDFLKILIFALLAFSYIFAMYATSKVAKMKGRDPIGWGVFFFFLPFIAMVSIKKVKPLSDEGREFCEQNKKKIKRLLLIPDLLLVVALMIVIIWAFNIH